MLETVEYVLRIVLRLRDEATKKLAAVRTEIAALSKDASAAEVNINKMNSRVSALTDSMLGLNNELEKLSSVMKKIGDDDDFDRIAGKIEKATTALEKFRGTRGGVGGGGVAEEPTGTTDIASRVRAKIQIRREQEVIERQAERDRQDAAILARRRAVAATFNLDEMFKVIVAVAEKGKNKGKEVIRVLDRETDKIIGERRFRGGTQARERPQDTPIAGRIIGQELGRRQQAAEQTLAIEQARAPQVEKKILDDAIIDEARAQVEHTEAIKKDTVVQQESTKSARQLLNERAQELGIGFSGKSSKLLQELIGAREKERAEVDKVVEESNGMALAIRKVKERWQIIETETRTVVARNFKSYENALGALTAMTNLNVKSVEESTDALNRREQQEKEILETRNRNLEKLAAEAERTAEAMQASRFSIERVGTTFNIIDRQTGEAIKSKLKSHEDAIDIMADMDILFEKTSTDLSNVLQERADKIRAQTKPRVQLLRTEDVAQFAEFDRSTPKNKEHFDKLKAEIEREGIKVPLELSVNKVGKAFFKEGNHRLAIARELGIQEIPVVVTFRDIQGQRGRGRSVPGPVPEVENLTQLSPSDVGLEPVKATAAKLRKLQQALEDYERSIEASDQETTKLTTVTQQASAVKKDVVVADRSQIGDYKKLSAGQKRYVDALDGEVVDIKQLNNALKTGRITIAVDEAEKGFKKLSQDVNKAGTKIAEFQIKFDPTEKKPPLAGGAPGGSPLERIGREVGISEGEANRMIEVFRAFKEVVHDVPSADMLRVGRDPFAPTHDVPTRRAATPDVETALRTAAVEVERFRDRIRTTGISITDVIDEARQHIVEAERHGDTGAAREVVSTVVRSVHQISESLREQSGFLPETERFLHEMRDTLTQQQQQRFLTPIFDAQKFASELRNALTTSRLTTAEHALGADEPRLATARNSLDKFSHTVSEAIGRINQANIRPLRPPVSGGAPGGGGGLGIDPNKLSFEQRRAAIGELNNILGELRQELRGIPESIIEAHRQGTTPSDKVEAIVDQMREVFSHIEAFMQANIVSRPEPGTRGIQVEERSRGRQTFSVLDEQGERLSRRFFQLADAEKFLELATNDSIDAAKAYEETIRKEGAAKRQANREALAEAVQAFKPEPTGRLAGRARDARGRLLPAGAEPVQPVAITKAVVDVPSISASEARQKASDERQLKAFDTHIEKLKELDARFEIVGHTLDNLPRRLAEGSDTFDEFIFKADKLRGEIDKLARFTPGNFPHGVELAASFNNASKAVQTTIDKFRDLGKSDQDVAALVRGIEAARGHVVKFADTFSHLTDQIDLSRGAMQIIRREGEQMRGLGTGALTEEITSNVKQLADLETNLRTRQREGGATTTVERNIQRLTSRLQAQRSVLQAMLTDATSVREAVDKVAEVFHELTVESGGGGAGAPPQVPTAFAFDEGDNEKIRGLIDQRDHLLRQNRDLEISNQDTITGLKRIAQEYANLSRAYRVGSDEYLHVIRQTQTVMDVVGALEEQENTKKREALEINKLSAKAEQDGNRARAETLRLSEETTAKVAALTNQQRELLRQRREEGLELDKLATGLKRIAGEYQALARANKDNVDQFDHFSTRATEIGAQASSIAKLHNDQLVESNRLQAAAEKATERAAAADNRARVKQLDNLVKARDEYNRLLDVVQQLTFELDNQLRAPEKLAAEFKDVATQAKRLAPALGPTATPEHRQALDLSISAGATSKKILDDQAGALQRNQQFVDNLTTAFAKLNHEYQTGNVDLREAGVRFNAFRSAFSDLERQARKIEFDSPSARRFGVEASRAGDLARDALKKVTLEASKTGNAFERLAARFFNVGSSIGNMSTNVAKIDNQLRGLVVLAIFAFAQQLLTGLTGLAGGLFSVGSSAAFAAGALGGSFVAGIAQALPAIGLLTAALAQVKSVTQAVAQVELVRLQGMQRAVKDEQKSAQAKDAQANADEQLLSAEEGLADARDRVKEANDRLDEAQKKLTEARKEAKANLVDLIQAERDAELAARGAVLSQAEAQDRLAQALQGGSDIALQQAQLGVFQSNLDVGRTRRAATRATTAVTEGRDIERTPGVVAAKKEIEDARKGIDDAQKSVVKAQRSLDQAGRAADNAAARATIATDESINSAKKLQFMLSLLTPAQLRLFVALENIRIDFQRIFGQVTDLIVDSFVRAVDTADAILKNPKFIQTAKGLAGAIADSFDTIRIHFFEDPQKLGQIFGIIDQATQNLPDITGIVTDFGDAFLNIAETAGPALSTIIGWVKDLSGDIKDLTDHKDKLRTFFNVGAEHATSWGDLVKNTVILFATLAGAGAANEGLSLVQELNDSIVDATKWIQTHRTDVAQFFSDSADVVRTIAGVLLDLGKAVVTVFDSDKFRHFADFFTNVVLPALVIVTLAVGTLIDAVLQLFNLNIFGFPIGKFLGYFVTFGITIAILAAIVTSIAGAFLFLRLQLAQSFLIFSTAANWLGRLSGGIGGVIGKIAELAGKSKLLAPLAGALEGIAGKLKSKGAAAAGTTLADDVAAVAGGPSLTTAGGRTVTTAPRKGVLGKLGLKKVLVSEADDAVKAAEGVAAGGGAKFGSKFALGASGLLKSFGWAAVGFAVFEGITTGFKTGRLDSAVRDFMHSLSFGIFDSAAEVAKKAADELAKQVQGKLPGLPAGVPTADFTTPSEFQAQHPGTILPRGGATELALKKQDGAAQAAARSYDAFVEKIKQGSPEAGKAIEKLPDLVKQLNIGSKRGEGIIFFENLKTQIGKLKEQVVKQFPQLAPLFDQYLDKLNAKIDKLQEKVKPIKIATDLTFGLARLDFDKIKPKDWKKNWKGVVDEALAEAEKLPPGLQRKSESAILAMVAQLKKDKNLPANVAHDIKELVIGKFEDMRSKTATKTRQTKEAADTNMRALAITAQTYMEAMGVNVNTILGAFGIGKVKIPTLSATFPAAIANQPLTKRGGGIVGMASGGMFGLPGERGKDTILAALGRGEMVFNAFQQRYLSPAVQSYYGHSLSDVFKRVKGEHAGAPQLPFDFPRFAVGRDSGTIDPLDGHPGNIARALRDLITLLKRRFPDSIVTSTTDHSTRTSTGGISDHVSGHAVDISGPTELMTKMVSFINSSGIWKQLKQGIHDPGLAVNQGKRVSGPGFFQQAWPEHINHIHLAVGDRLGQIAADISTHLRRQKLNFPVEGPVKEFGQTVLDIARRAGQRLINRKLREQSGADFSGDVKIPHGTGQRNIIRQAARIVGMPARYLWGVYGAESDFGRNAGSSSAGAQGPFQFLPGTADAYVPGGRANINNFAAAAVGAARYLKFLFNMFKSWPEAIGHYNSGPGGNITNPETAAYIPKVLQLAQSFRRGGVAQFADGGIVPGGEGIPVGIIAHAGEWMVNKQQQRAIASWMGTSVESVRTRLGFSGGPHSFAGGGEPPTLTAQQKKLNFQFSSAAEESRIKDIMRGIFRLPLIPLQSWEQVVKESFNATQAINHIGQRIAAATKNSTRNILNSRFINTIDNITKENTGLIAQAEAARERLSTQLTNGLTFIALRLNKAGDVIKRKSATAEAIAARESANAGKELDQIIGEKGIITDALDAVNAKLRNLRRGGIKGNEGALIQRLTTQQSNLRKSLDGINTDLATAMQTRFDKQVAVFQATVDKINATADTATAKIDLGERKVTRLGTAATGDTTGVQGIADERMAVLTAQADALKKQVRKFRRIGDSDTANAIQAQIDGIRESVKEIAKAKLQAVIDGINTAAQIRETGFGIRDRMAAVFGNKGALNQIADDRIASMNQQVADLQGPLAAAAAAGNADLVQSITQEITDLNTSIAEVAKQKIQNTIDAVNDTAQKKEALLGVRERLANLFGNTGALAQIANERINNLHTQMDGLQQALAQAKEGGNQDLVDSLTQQIADVNASIEETISAQFRTTLDQINKATQRKTSRLDLINRMADAVGAVGLGGAATVGGQTLSRAQVFEQRGQALQEQRGSVQDLLRQVMTEQPQNVQLIQDLTDQLAELDVTIAENTKAAFDAKVADVNNKASFSLNILSLQQRIAELTGTISQSDSSQQVLALLQQRAVILQQQGNALQALLIEAQTNNNQQAINDLTTQLLENQVAVLENTDAVNKLTGQSNLQGFSSSAWQLFRKAIFDGLGNLLPQFAMAVPSAAVGAKIMQGGLIRVHDNEIIVPATVARTQQSNGGAQQILTEVNITNPTETADPVYIGNAIGFRIANNPNLRP